MKVDNNTQLYSIVKHYLSLQHTRMMHFLLKLYHKIMLKKLTRLCRVALYSHHKVRFIKVLLKYRISLNKVEHSSNSYKYTKTFYGITSIEIFFFFKYTKTYNWYDCKTSTTLLL